MGLEFSKIEWETKVAADMNIKEFVKFWFFRA